MRVYTVHRRDGDVAVVREGFAWWALPVPLLWALWHHLWWWALIVLGAGLLLAVAAGTDLLSPVEAALAAIGFSILFAAEANDIRRRALYWRGWVEEGVSTGANADLALRRWADRARGEAAYA
ncbi:MAG: DUF2628 domain-containing protein [Alphaproteobacteria bacterium]